MSAKDVLTAGSKLASAISGNRKQEAEHRLREFVYAIGQTLAGLETRIKELEEEKAQLAKAS